MSVVKFQKYKKGRKQIPFTLAIIWILLSTFFISGSAYFAYFYYQHIQAVKKADSKYNVVAIVQQSQSKELLQSEYLAEQLGLSIDMPTNLYSFNIRRGEQQLVRSPLIQSASINKVSPGTLFVDYSIRRPLAYLGDLTNTAIDGGGVLIPFKPFFTPKSLPTIILGASFFNSWQKGEHWGHSIIGEEFLLAKKIIHFFENEKCGDLKTIDLKTKNSLKLGSREIVLTVKCKKNLYLRLPVEHPLGSLKDFKYLYFSSSIFSHLDPEVVDLRIRNQALISKYPD